MRAPGGLTAARQGRGGKDKKRVEEYCASGAGVSLCERSEIEINIEDWITASAGGFGSLTVGYAPAQALRPACIQSGHRLTLSFSSRGYGPGVWDGLIGRAGVSLDWRSEEHV
mgnify:FL=1